MKLPRNVQISPERARFVIEEISIGSEPGLRFYILVIVSTMIAGFGLTMNSTAVIIGAMLVAPLMTPIFGMALALVRGDARLLGRASQAELAGVAAAIAMGFLLGFVYPSLEPTPEMISRTQPQLFDLLVAIFSGFAGAYALVDEKISPALPGVAIATAIVPPLANTGLCFSMGAYSGGVGSFLLFFSNFLSILLVASLVFWAFGMAGKYHDLDRQVLIKRFGLPTAGFLIVTIVLSHTLYTISADRHLKRTIETVVIESLFNLPAASFDKLVYHDREDRIEVLAYVHSASVISPTQVSKIQDSLEQRLNREVALSIQSNIARTVGALDVYSQIGARDLDGNFISADIHPRVLKTKMADTLIRNYLKKSPGLSLIQVRFLNKDDLTILLATISSFVYPAPETIEAIESLLREKLEEPNLQFIVQTYRLEMFGSDGRIRFDLTGFVELTPDQKQEVDLITDFIEQWFTGIKDFTVTKVDYTVVEDDLYFFIDVKGLQTFKVEEVKKLEQAVDELHETAVRIHVLSNIGTVSTASSYETYDEFSRQIFKTLRPTHRANIEQLIEQSNL